MARHYAANAYLYYRPSAKVIGLFNNCVVEQAEYRISREPVLQKRNFPHQV